MSSQYLLDTSRNYALYVCENRAVPHVTDGLKHGQRMALWVMRHRADKLKTIALSGLLSYERLYVHGDVSCNNAIGLLAAPYKNNIPLIEGLGEFGSRVSPDAIGAPRYTELRRTKAAQAFLYNDLDIIPLEDNYDGSNQQPKHFLPLIPTVLLNGVSGIAVGWSTNILPRSLKALIEATKQALLDQPIKPLEPYYARYNIAVTAAGPNQWELVGQASSPTSNTVQITELTPGMNIEMFRRRLIDMEAAELIQGFTDRSTETINITVKMKRGSVPQDIIGFFKLRERVTERIVVIDWDGEAIRTYDTAEALVQDFVQWRSGWYVRRFESLRDRDRCECTYWQALHVLFEHGFPKRLGTFPDRTAMQAHIMEIVQKARIELDDEQVERIVSLPTYRWTREFAAQVVIQIASLQAAIAEYEAILASPTRLRDVYITELDNLKGMRLQ